MSRVNAYTVVWTSAADRGHSRSSMHHGARAGDLAVIPWAGQDLIVNPGVRVGGLDPSVWFAVGLARAFVAELVGPIEPREANKLLANYLDRALAPIGVDVLFEGDHVHTEYQPKQPAIFDPARIREEVRQAGAGVDPEKLERIADRMVALRHVNG